MNRKHFLRALLAALTLCALLMPVAAGAEEGGLAVGVYVVNSRNAFEEADTAALIADTAIAATALRIGRGPVSLTIARPMENDQDRAQTVFQSKNLGLGGLRQISDAVAKIQGVPMGQNNLSYRVGGLSALADSLAASGMARKLLILFTSINEWEAGYTDALKNFPGEVLVVRLLPDSRSLNVPSELERVTVIKADGYDAEVMSKALSMAGLTDGADETVRVTRLKPDGGAVNVAPENGYIVSRSALIIGQRPESVPGAAYESGRLCLMTFGAQSDASVPLPAGCEAYAVDRLDRYAVAAARAGETVTVAKGETAALSCEIGRLGTSGADEITQWQVVAALTAGDGQTREEPLTRDPETGRYQGGVALLSSGDYACLIRATNALGVTIESEPWTLRVGNAAPKASAEQLTIELWQRSPIALDTPTADLLSLFEDDDLATVTFSLEPETEELTLEGALLSVAEGAEPRYVGEIVARDAEGETARLPLQTRLTDAREALESGELTLAQIAPEARKAEEIEVSATYRLSDAGRAYAALLIESGRGDELTALLQGRFALQDDVGAAITEALADAQWGEEGDILFRAAMTLPVDSGAYSLTGSLRWLGEAEAFTGAVAESRELQVLNQPPEVIAQVEPFELILPDALGGSGDELRLSERLLISDYVAGEPGEKLILTPVGTALRLWHTGEDAYLLTDAADAEGERVEQIVWDTGRAAPSLEIALTKPAESVGMALTIRDGEGAEADRALELHGSARTLHQELLRTIRIVAAAAALLLVAALALWWAMKPSFRRTRLELLLERGCERALPLQGWKKGRLTLWEAVLYTGLPIVDDIPYGELEKLAIAPARGQRYALTLRKGCALTLMGEDGQELRGERIAIELGRYVTVSAEGRALLRLRVTHDAA